MVYEAGGACHEYVRAGDDSRRGLSEGIGGDATAPFGLFQPPEEYVKSHDQYPA